MEICYDNPAREPASLVSKYQSCVSIKECANLFLPIRKLPFLMVNKVIVIISLILSSNHFLQSENRKNLMSFIVIGFLFGQWEGFLIHLRRNLLFYDFYGRILMLSLNRSSFRIKLAQTIK